MGRAETESHIEQQWTRRLLPRLLVLRLPRGLLVTRARQPQQLLAWQVVATGQVVEGTELQLEQRLVPLELLLVIMVAVLDRARRRRRRKIRDLDQRRRRRRTRRGRGQRKKRRKVREAGRQEVPPAVLDLTQTDLAFSLYSKCVFHKLERVLLQCLDIFEIRVPAIFFKICLRCIFRSG